MNLYKRYTQVGPPFVPPICRHSKVRSRWGLVTDYLNVSFLLPDQAFYQMNRGNAEKGRLVKSDQITNSCSEPNDLLTSLFGLYE